MTTVVDAPARADGVQLLGEMAGSGYRTPPALVRRGDGQTLQLTPLLYLVLKAADGTRSCEEIAEVVGAAIQRAVTPEAVATLVDDQLRPLGLLTLADGTQAPLQRSDPLLGLRWKFSITDPRTTRRLTDPFRVLFRPVPVAIVVAGFLAVVWWVFFERGLAPAAYDAFQRPHLLLLVFVVTLLSAGFHELGHAAAARYGGAQPGRMGGGVYIVWPAFYTDVTDSYRLGRWGRVRTDLGGLYFNALVVGVTFLAWRATGRDALLLLVATQILQMVQQLMPMLRFDGYHLLADLTGVPDLFQRIKPTLLGLLPHRWRDPSNAVLKPWARVVITAWVLVTVPLLAVMLAGMVTALPRLLGTAWSTLRKDAGQVGRAWSDGSPLDVAANSLQVLAVLLPTLACMVILARMSRRWTTSLVAWSRGSVRRRAVAVVVVATVLGVLAWAWFPQDGRYRPISPHERGLVTQLLPGSQQPVAGAAARPAPELQGVAAKERLRDGSALTATFERGRPLPSKDDPQLALVLVPRTGGGAASGGGEEPWVFPFDRPLPPGEGDNQAAAYNTTDGSVRYDVAFALVWADGDEVRNTNVARAYASCTDCVTVAVAFQVLLVMDDATVVVPQNLAVAANYQCQRCITAAVASQLVLSVGSEPGEEELAALSALWQQLVAFGRDITAYSLTEITQRLEQVKRDITTILRDVVATSPDSPEPSGTAVSTAPDDDPSASPSEPAASPSEQESADTAAEPSDAPSPTSEPSPSEPAPSSGSAPATPTEGP